MLLYPVEDVNIHSGTPTDRRDINPMYIQRYSGDSYRVLMTFVIPPNPGNQQIDSLKLSIVRSGEFGTSPQIEVRKISQSGFDINNCSWVKYNATSNWNVAGGDFGNVLNKKTTVVGTNSFFLLGGDEIESISVAWGETISLILKYENDISAPASNWFGLYASEQAGVSNDPVLELLHSDIPVIEPQNGANFFPFF